MQPQQATHISKVLSETMVSILLVLYASNGYKLPLWPAKDILQKVATLDVMLPMTRSKIDITQENSHK